MTIRCRTEPRLDRHRDSEGSTPGPAKRLTCHRAASLTSIASTPLPRDWECRFRRVLHPHVHRLLRPVFQPSLPFTTLSCPPPSITFRPSRPDCGLSTECSLFPSNRGRFTPVSATKSPSVTSPSNSISCTAPSHGPHPSISAEPGRCIKRDASYEGYAPQPDQMQISPGHTPQGQVLVIPTG